MGDDSHESSAYSFAQTDDDYSSSPSRIMPFMSKLEYSEHEMEAADNIFRNPMVEKELGQFWPINKYDGMFYVYFRLSHTQVIVLTSGVNQHKVLLLL